MSRASAELNAAIDEFLEGTADIDTHTARTDNPHGVTKAQVGLGNADNTSDAAKPISTAVQTALDSKAASSALTAHTGNTANPHSVTKAQIGLGNVTNDEQTKKTTYNAHKAGTADKHKAEDIIYDANHSVKEYVDALVLNSGSGTTDHSLLQNRSLADAHPFSAISGTEDVIGRVFTFTGTTTNATETQLLATPNASFDEDTDYIDEDGRLTLPVGVAANCEIYVMAVTKTGGALQLDSAAFKTQGAIMRANSMVKPALDEVTKYDMTSDSSNAFAFSVGNHSIGVLKLSATGKADTTVYWQARVVLKNIYKAGE